jgi:hypothetical protein
LLWQAGQDAIMQSVTNIFNIVASLTFKNPIYIGQAYHYPPDVAFYIFFSTNISTEYFKHAAHSPFFLFKVPFIS